MAVPPVWVLDHLGAGRIRMWEGLNSVGQSRGILVGWSPTAFTPVERVAGWGAVHVVGMVLGDSEPFLVGSTLPMTSLPSTSSELIWYRSGGSIKKFFGS